MFKIMHHYPVLSYRFYGYIKYGIIYCRYTLYSAFIYIPLIYNYNDYTDLDDEYNAHSHSNSPFLNLIKHRP